MKNKASITSPIQFFILFFALVFIFGLAMYFSNPPSWKTLSIPRWVKWLITVWILSGTSLYFYSLKNIKFRNLDVGTLKETTAEIDWKNFLGLWLTFIFNWPFLLIAGYLTEGEPMIVFPVKKKGEDVD